MPCVSFSLRKQTWGTLYGALVQHSGTVQLHMGSFLSYLEKSLLSDLTSSGARIREDFPKHKSLSLPWPPVSAVTAPSGKGEGGDSCPSSFTRA